MQILHSHRLRVRQQGDDDQLEVCRRGPRRQRRQRPPACHRYLSENLNSGTNNLKL